MVQTVTDLEGAKKYLFENPNSIDAFDKNYGAGAANAVMNGTYKSPEELQAAVTQREADQSGPQGVLSNIADMGVGLVNGVERAINETAQTINSVGNAAEDYLGVGRLVWDDKNGDGKVDLIPSYWDREKVVANASNLKQDAITKFTEELNVIPEAQGTAGQLTQGISQFIAGFAGISRAAGVGNGFFKALAKGAVVDATVFDPYEQNLSAVMNSMDWAEPYVLDALATDPNGKEWENRLRNSLEGGVLGVATEGLVKGIKMVALARKAKLEITSIGKITDETAAQLDETNAEVVKIADEVEPKPEGLIARPDGSFEAPDGSVFKPEGETLQPVSVPEALPQVDLPNADLGYIEVQSGPLRLELNNPMNGADPNSSAARIQAQAEAGANLGEQVTTVKTQVKPKVPLIDKEVFRESLKRIDGMSGWDIRNIDDGGSFNFERMDGPVDAAKVIDEFQNVLSDEGIAKSMGLDKPQSHQEVTEQALKYVAEVTNTDVNTLIKTLNITETITRDMAAKIVAGKMALQSTGRQVTRLAAKVDAAATGGKGSEELERQLFDAMQLHAEVQANVKGLQTAAARATAAGRIATGDALADNTLDALSAFGGSKRIRELAKKLKDVKTDAGTAAMVKKAVERKWIGVLNEYWINQVLSGYKTHMLNMTSNSINLFLLPAERFAGGVAIGVKSGDYTQAKVAMKQYKYLFSSFTDSIQLAAKTGWNERATLDSSIKYDVGGGSKQAKMTAENFGLQGTTRGSAIDAVGKLFRMPSRFLLAEDEFFKQLSFRSRLKAMLEVDAEMLSPDELTKMGYATKDDFFKGELDKALVSQTDALERYQELVLTGKILDDPQVKEQFVQQSLGGFNSKSKYAEQAIREARNTTFTNPLEKGSFSASIQELASRHPVMRQIIPFIQTPMNVMSTAWDRTPVLNMARRQYREALKSPDPNIRAEAYGKLATGTTIVGTLAMLGLDGRITGGGPTDPKKAAFWRASKDWQPYSINFGTAEKPNWVSYAKLDPHTTLFGIVGDIIEMNAYQNSTPDADNSALWAMTIAAVGNNIVSKTYLQGISDVVTLLDSKDKPWAVEQFINQKVASFVPFSSLQSQVGQANDDYMREARGFLDTVKSKWLLSRADLPIKYDWLTGKAMEGPEHLLVLPQIQKKALADENSGAALVQREIRKINYTPAGPDRKVGGVTLNAQQFHRWNELMGTVSLGRKNLVERLGAKIQSDRYQSYSNNHGEFTVQEDPRVDALRVIISDYKTRSLKMLRREFPDLNKAITDYERYKKMAKAGRDGERPVLDMNLK